jgi:transcriptional regulator with GAF, ATPase, and Fis domain
VNPRLSVVAGPYKESVFAIDQDEITIGRDPINLLAIGDPSLSRRHCVITRDGECLKIRDLDSRNGTFVNGEAVKEAVLKNGDQLSFGDSVFLLQLADDAQKPAAGAVEFDDCLTHATAQLRPQDVIYLHPEQILSQLPATSRIARNLNALLKISRVIHAISDLEALQAQILSLIFEVTPAENGVILLEPLGGDQFGSKFSCDRLGNKHKTVRVSRTITRQVMEQGIAILGSDVPGSMKDVESLVMSKVRSLLCVPLTVFHRATGCIYLDTTTMAARLEEENLQMVAAVAGISAVALDNARRLQWLEQENLRLTTEINLEHNMVGDSAAIKEVFRVLSRVSRADSTVLIEGESGTGKELAARAIHRNSPRAAKPFSALNCAAIPEHLLESELFGHEKGSFTGATGLHKGKFEVANGGTVFLDEIAEMAPGLQSKLLRVLQEREFERVGGTRTIPVDIRLVAATNKDLKEAVKDGTFRSDLYFRLNVVSLVMPPLRERREDIPMLTDYFVKKVAQKSNLNPKPLSPEAAACLLNYDWPGNVRELENAVERALVMSVSDVILPEDLPETILERDSPPGVNAAKYHIALKDLKKKLILDAIEESHGNYTEAARVLGVHPNYLHRLIRNLDIKSAVRVGSAKPAPRIIRNA